MYKHQYYLAYQLIHLVNFFFIWIRLIFCRGTAPRLKIFNYPTNLICQAIVSATILTNGRIQDDMQFIYFEFNTNGMYCCTSVSVLEV